MSSKLTYYQKLPFTSDPYVQAFGELLFYYDGGVRLGGTWFGYGAPIHRHRFGANLVACRHIDEPMDVIVHTPDSATLHFQYRPWQRLWYQILDVNDPKFLRNYERYGLLVAFVLHHLPSKTRGLILSPFGLVLVPGVVIWAIEFIQRFFD